MQEFDTAKYKPTSLTVTMYDTESSVYGFTFNTQEKPLCPVIRIRKEGDGQWSEHPFRSYEATTVNKEVQDETYYVSKAQVALERGSVYSYFVWDKGCDVRTAETQLRTNDNRRKTFSFAHVSDSQEGPQEFRDVLSRTYKRMDFLVHTGDFVQRTKYEYQWTEMLDGSYQYLSAIPLMPMGGNHECRFGSSAGKYEIEKHFNVKLPFEQSTVFGCFYSFVYGNVKFIVLNTNELEDSRLKDDQYGWLVKELKENPCTWTVVAMHNPIYSVGQYGVIPERNGIARALKEQIHGLFAEYGVDIVLQGHDHAISRTFPISAEGKPRSETVEAVDGIGYSLSPKGVIYLMNGPAGTQTRIPVEVDQALYKYAQSSNAASWAELSVDGNTLTVEVKWYDSEGEHTYHKWGIRK